MIYKEQFDYWCGFSESVKAELEAITDEKEIEDRFYKDLEFGTGGLRGIMGAGPNRMNIYTVAKATKGYADYLKAVRGGDLSVAIAYDTRNNSLEFARAAAGVLCANGIKTYIFDSVMPTPVLSFAVRFLGADGGIVITASHNPKEYNGYKIYDEKGCQLVPAKAGEVIKYVGRVTDLKNIDSEPFLKAVSGKKAEIIGEEVLNAFLKEVKKQSLYREKSDLKIVYTPLHGTGSIPVRRILEGMNVSPVEEQLAPDGNFSTVRSPNPEEKDALTLGILKAEKEKADIVLGTDPDCDRVGAAVLHGGVYTLVTGNQMGALLADFVLSCKAGCLNSRSTLVKTIVTGELGAKIAQSRGLNVENTLTGFKYIGDKIGEYEESKEKEFVMGYEESYGYLVGTHARDKDAVVASMLICEMAAYYKNRGETLIDALERLYAEYGYYLDCLDTFVLKGKDGAEKIKACMAKMRAAGGSLFEGNVKVLDYSKGIDGLPTENVLKYIFDDGSFVAVRPSGTEPKLKAYYSVRGENKEQASEKLSGFRAVLAKETEA